MGKFFHFKQNLFSISNGKNVFSMIDKQPSGHYCIHIIFFNNYDFTLLHLRIFTILEADSEAGKNPIYLREKYFLILIFFFQSLLNYHNQIYSLRVKVLLGLPSLHFGLEDTKQHKQIRSQHQIVGAGQGCCCSCSGSNSITIEKSSEFHHSQST